VATRVYPATKNTAVLEALAGVPAGTAAAFAAYNAEHQPPRYDNESLPLWDAYFAGQTPAMSNYETFEIQGWGRLRGAGVEPALRFSDQVYNGYPVAGRTTDRFAVAAILAGLGVVLPPSVTIEDLEGVYWC
jgi:hypothetical protein